MQHMIHIISPPKTRTQSLNIHLHSSVISFPGDNLVSKDVESGGIMDFFTMLTRFADVFIFSIHVSYL